MKKLKNSIKLRCLYKILSVFIAIYVGLFTTVFILVNLTKNKIYPLKYKEDVFFYAKTFDLEASLVFATIKVESSFSKDAVSSKGAMGLMQIKKETADYIAKNLNIKNFNLLDTKTNIKFGCYYIRYLLNKFSNVNTAVCAYNAGEGIVKKWLENPKYSVDNVSLIKIPYNETKEYLSKITFSKEKYEKLYPKLLTKN